VPLDRFVGFAFVWLALVAVMWDRVRMVARSRHVREPLTPTA
jgi:hypothetical protein